MSQRSSSRWFGSVASGPLRRSCPRSSTSTSVPLAVSARATSAAVNPPPTMTTVFLASGVAMTPSLLFHSPGEVLAEVRDRLRILGARKRLAAEFHHVVAVRRRQARIADHAPKHLVAVAAIDRIG